jgi:tetratricopeptide (TPR) repeat protein
MKKFVLVFLLCTCLGTHILAKKMIVWDDNLGIVFKDEAEILKKRAAAAKNKAEVKGPPEAGTERMNSAQDYFDKGKSIFKNGDHAEALEYFKIAYKKKPTEAVYYYWIGACYLHLENYEKMDECFARILKLYRTSKVADDALFFRAFLAQHNQNYKRALVLYREFIDSFPDGTSIINGVKFTPMARVQISKINVELTTMLDSLKVKGGSMEQRLNNFQRKSNLETTGEPDSLTVGKLVFKSDSLKNYQSSIVAHSQEIRGKRKLVFAGLSFFFLINIVGSIFNMLGFSNKKERLAALLREYV